MTFQKLFSDLDLMRAVSEMKPVTVRQLANRIGVSRQAIHWRLCRLERRGKVKRQEGDKRKRKPDLWFCFFKDDESGTTT